MLGLPPHVVWTLVIMNLILSLIVFLYLRKRFQNWQTRQKWQVIMEIAAEQKRAAIQARADENERWFSVKGQEELYRDFT